MTDNIMFGDFRKLFPPSTMFHVDAYDIWDDRQKFIASNAYMDSHPAVNVDAYDVKSVSVYESTVWVWLKLGVKNNG